MDSLSESISPNDLVVPSIGHKLRGERSMYGRRNQFIKVKLKKNAKDY